MTPLGIGIVGTGNIAGGYAKDALTHPEIRLVAATDLDPDRATAFAATHGIRAHASLDDLLADDEVDIVINLTVHHAHYEVTKRALEAGKHVYSEKPLALRSSEARELVTLATSRGLRLGCSPSTFLGEAQQTAATVIRSGRLGPVRAVYAEVNWGRIETWHPAPAPFYDVGVLVDVGVYPLTLVTTMLGPARSVRAWGWSLLPERATLDGTPFRIGSPDLIVAAVELETGAVLRLTASFYVGRPARQIGGSSSTAMRARSRWAISRTSTRRSRSAPSGRHTSRSRCPAGLSRDGLGSRRGGHGDARSSRAGRTGRVRNRPPTSWTSSREPPSPSRTGAAGRDRLDLRVAGADVLGRDSGRPVDEGPRPGAE